MMFRGISTHSTCYVSPYCRFLELIRGAQNLVNDVSQLKFSVTGLALKPKKRFQHFRSTSHRLTPPCSIKQTSKNPLICTRKTWNLIGDFCTSVLLDVGVAIGHPPPQGSDTFAVIHI